VLVPNSDDETQEALRTARREIVQLEADAVLGDLRAKDKLMFFRDALDNFREDDPPVSEVNCTNCGSQQLDLCPIEGHLFDAQDAWVRCPRCEEGRLLVETTGRWD
jgi:ribosomal protein S27E